MMQIMELLALLFGKKKTEEVKTLADYKREQLIKLGEEQFRTLIEKGLGIPVALSK